MKYLILLPLLISSCVRTKAAHILQKKIDGCEMLYMDVCEKAHTSANDVADCIFMECFYSSTPK